MAAFAPALTPMLATPPARMFVATNMLVCVLLLLHFCAKLLFSLCVRDRDPKHSANRRSPIFLCFDLASDVLHATRPQVDDEQVDQCVVR